MRVLDYPLLADENVAPEVVAALRQRGCDVRTVLDESLGGADDQSILDRAKTLGRVVITHDRDLGELATRAGGDFLGIVFVRPGHVAAAVVLQSFDALASIETEPQPPFIVVATRIGDVVRIRVRTVAAAG